MVRLLAITFGSLALTTFSIMSIFYKTRQFYPTVIYLTKNRICLTTIIFQCFVFYFLFLKLMCRIFFGALQRTEMDNIISRYWFVFVDMCLVFASYQDQLSISFLFSFAILLFAKGFHWLIDERVEYMERTPVISKLFHFRCISLLIILGYIDCYFIRTQYWKPSSVGDTLYLALGFEYFSMLFSLILTFVRYSLHTIDSRRSTPWDQKNMYILIMDALVGFLKFLLYVETMFIIWKLDHFPLFLVRPVYLSIRFMKKSLKDLILSRRAIGFMNTVFKNATEEDLAAISDPTCIICREDMCVGEENNSNHGVVKKLTCGHLFHSGCLRSWFQRQQTCPTCRMDVISQANNARNNNNRPEYNNNQQPQNNPPANRQSETVPSAAPSNGPNEENNMQSAQFGSTQNSSSLPPQPPNLSTNQPFQIPQLLPGTMFPIIMPTFPPVSSPPPNLSQNDIDSLFLDEESLRASVEARMAALRQVQTLLDAAMLQMNAYLSAIASNPPQSNTCEGAKKNKEEEEETKENDEQKCNEKKDSMSNQN